VTSQALVEHIKSSALNLPGTFSSSFNSNTSNVSAERFTSQLDYSLKRKDQSWLLVLIAED
jgi:hypothetical protein